MSDGIKQDSRTGQWNWQVGSTKGYSNSKEQAAKHYASALIQKNPKYQPLVKGKAWPEVFKVLGIKV